MRKEAGRKRQQAAEKLKKQPGEKAAAAVTDDDAAGSPAVGTAAGGRCRCWGQHLQHEDNNKIQKFIFDNISITIIMLIFR